jgi:hypothetical protein
VDRSLLFHGTGIRGLVFLFGNQLLGNQSRDRAGEAQAQQKKRDLIEAGLHEDSPGKDQVSSL